MRVAVATMLSMIAPLALAHLMHARRTLVRVLYGLAFALLLLGALSTLRRTAVVAPLALFIVFVLYRPRDMYRLLPCIIPFYVLGRIFTPGAGGNVIGQLTGANSLSAASTEGRTEDYIAVHMDVLSRPLLGRGYGGYQLDQYRVLDNQYLGLIIEVGLIGVLCFILVVAGGWVRAHHLQRASDSWTSWLAVGVLAATAVFAVGSAFFDTLAFPQPTYMFLLLTALVAVAATHAQRSTGASPAETPSTRL